MRSHSEYESLAFVKEIENCFRDIKKEFFDILSDPNLGIAALDMPSAKQSIKKKDKDWQFFGLNFHHRCPIDMINEYDMLSLNPELETYLQTYNRIKLNHFSNLFDLFLRLQKMTGDGLITSFISITNPGADVPLHIDTIPFKENQPSYMARTHLGLLIPEGDVGMQVGEELLQWQEGRVLVFNPSLPHRVWNRSNAPRAILGMDFYDPFGNRKELERIREKHFNYMMKKSPLSFGMSGGQTKVSKFGLHKSVTNVARTNMQLKKRGYHTQKSSLFSSSITTTKESGLKIAQNPTKLLQLLSRK